MNFPELTMKCACAFGKKYIWNTVAPQRTVPMETYIRRSNCMAEACEAYGLKAALHNHLGCRIQDQEELDEYMEKVPGSYLLLDIGHLQAAGGDCAGTIRRYHDRLAAVHFKDCFIKDEKIGLDRWPERLRFCELNGGNCGLPLEEIVRALRDCKYDKWLLIEHDTHLRAPEIDLKKIAGILKDLFA